MIAVVQRVAEASVVVGDETVGRIDRGLCVLVGVERGDDRARALQLAGKIAKLRIFPDDEGKMNRSVADVGGSVLIVSQFTLAGDTSAGNRPSFINAAQPAEAEPLYEAVVESLQLADIPTATGRFRTHMSVRLVNDGPVTILLRA